MTPPRIFKNGDKIIIKPEKINNNTCDFNIGEIYEVEESIYGTDCYDFKDKHHEGWNLTFINENFELATPNNWNDILEVDKNA